MKCFSEDDKRLLYRLVNTISVRKVSESCQIGADDRVVMLPAMVINGENNIHGLRSDKKRSLNKIILVM